MPLTVSPASSFLLPRPLEVGDGQESREIFLFHHSSQTAQKKSQDCVSQRPFISWGLSAWHHGRGRRCWNLEAMEGFLEGWDGLNKGLEVESNEPGLQYKVCIRQGWETKLTHQVGIRS